MEKKVENIDGPTPNFTHRYAYDGWNLIAEYSVSSGTLSVIRSYTWGLDIVHELTKAGGVGALLQIVDQGTGTAYHAAYDGNGNVMALVNGSGGSVAASYEYSPFGETIRADGSYAGSNPFRFSSRFKDDETGLVYYGRRYYHPWKGRFLGRDPKEEMGGLNLYGFVGNNPITRWDYLGMCWAFGFGTDNFVQSMTRAGDVVPLGGQSVGGAAETTLRTISDSQAFGLGVQGAREVVLDFATGRVVSIDGVRVSSGSVSVGSLTTSEGVTIASTAVVGSVVSGPLSLGTFSTATAGAAGMVTTVPGVLPTSTGATGGVLSATGRILVGAGRWVLAAADTAVLAPLGAILMLTPTTMGNGEIRTTFDPVTGQLVPTVWDVNKMGPVPTADGPHTTIKIGPNGEITNYQTWYPQTNPRNPAPWQAGPRVDVVGKPHDGIPTPHVHQTDGTVRPANPHELPAP